MRRKEKQLSKSKALAILSDGEYGIMSTVSDKNIPYGIPLNYCLIGTSIYFHCALEGTKINNILNNPNVSFCVVGYSKVIPDKFETDFKSCIVNGTVSESFKEEKKMALVGLIEKFSKNYRKEGLKLINKLNNKTRVFKISVDSITGKSGI